MKQLVHTILSPQYIITINLYTIQSFRYNMEQFCHTIMSYNYLIKTYFNIKLTVLISRGVIYIPEDYLITL